jgi:hypothetical protein
MTGQLPSRASRTRRLPRPLTEPHPDGLALDDPNRTEILDRHAAALTAGEPGYLDPATGFYVFTAQSHLDRGTCCTNVCRHCPYRR